MTKYNPGGHVTWLSAPAIANLNAPTAAELSASVVLVQPNGDRAMKSAVGFSQTSSLIEVPDLRSRVTPKIPGRQTTGEATLTFYDDDEEQVVLRAALAVDSTGYIIRCPYGTTTGKRVEVYPYQVAGLNLSDDTSDNNAAELIASLAITDLPHQDAVLVA